MVGRKVPKENSSVFVAFTTKEPAMWPLASCKNEDHCASERLRKKCMTKEVRLTCFTRRINVPMSKGRMNAEAQEMRRARIKFL